MVPSAYAFTYPRLFLSYGDLEIFLGSMGKTREKKNLVTLHFHHDSMLAGF